MTWHGAFWKTYGIVPPIAKSPPKRLPIGQAQDDRVGADLDCFINEGRGNFTRLEQVASDFTLKCSAMPSA